ncbi:hypothetical protein HPB49_001224 [Dermacentor silvarum]|uniref:Uncharacterized protein n=1 Tax=Dermacentor silvarum TaxID=543639 RepID=A0ACB8C6P1_DERSI|nr:hypothetical protein HPB49_001224 [Dermacentor silvarum]
MVSPVRSVTSPFTDLYDYFWSQRDPRTEGWAFITDAKFTFPLLIGYVYFAKVAGPRWMKDRKPFDLKWAILTYNALTVIANAYFAVRLLSLTYVGGNYNLFCQGINYSSPSETDMTILSLGWWYSFITFLHVIHHFLVVLSGWFFMNFGGDGQPILGVCVNAFVHVIMYSYYFLAALGPAMQKYLWWKRYLTELQIAQFVGLMMHMAITLFYDCGYPKFLTMLALPQGFLGLGLFINFYIKSYRAQRKLHVSADKLKKHD